MKYSAIYPGQVWLDTNGNPIQAHGGSVLYVDGTYYWYGENKEKTTGKDDVWHWGVRCYASSDLYNWEDKGLIIPPDVDDPDYEGEKVDFEKFTQDSMRNTSIARYVWLPIRFDGEMPVLEWRDEWKIEDFE